MEPTPFGRSISLLRTRRFGTFWIASLLSNIGTWAQQVAQPWLLLSLGASPFLIGLDAFALGAPVWLLTLVGGLLADRADRRRIILKYQSIQMWCPILLVILLLLDIVQPWMVIVLSLVVGVTDALSMPSFQSIVPTIVARNRIASGLALNATQFNLSRILGPAIAGMLMVSVGAVGCFALSAASYLPFIAVALWILPGRADTAASSHAAPRQLISNVTKVLRSEHLRGAILTVFLSSLLCGPLVTFTPVLVKEVFHGGAGHFSLAVGAFGAGGLLGAIGLLFVAEGRDRRRISTGFAAGYGAVLVLAALNPWLWALPLLLVLGGLAMAVGNISSNTLLQSNTPPELRGQAISLYMLAMRGGLSIGSLITGISANLLGIGHALLINGAIALLAQWAVGRGWVKAGPPDQSIMRD